MEIIIIAGILFTFGYIILSTPGDKLRKRYSLFNTSLKSNSKEDEEVFECLKEAGIEPCFLNKDLQKYTDNKVDEKNGEIVSSGVKKAPLTNHHQLQMIILNSYENQNGEKDDEYSMKLRRK